MESFSEQFPSTSSPHATDQGQQSNTLASNYCKDFGDFAFLCNLEELVYMYSDLIALSDRSEVTRRDMDRLELLKKSLGDIKLTKSGRPTFLLLELMRDMVFQIFKIHEEETCHRDLKPQNVLIFKNARGNLSAKLSDQNTNSLSNYSMGTPEEDMFSLGCLLFFCLTGGRHPFGDDYHHDANIVENNVDLFLEEDFAEAYHLISSLLSPNPELRLNAIEVFRHPLLWDSVKRLSFLCDTSDLTGRPDHLKALGAITILDIGPKYWKGKSVTTWTQTMAPDIICNMCNYNLYDPASVSDLLLFVQNMWTYYKLLPKNVKELIGVKHRDNLDGYFTSLFPKLLMEVYKVICTHYKEMDVFEEYFNGGVDFYPLT